MADPSVDAVIVAVADQFRVPMVIRAIQAGKQVLIEKPMGVSVAECERRETVCGTMHPVSHGQRLAAGISGSRLVQIASRKRDPALHVLKRGKPSRLLSPRP